MSPRMRTFIILAAMAAFGPPASAEEKKASGQSRTWTILADHVLKNGVDQTIDAPMSRNLGFQTDEVPTKALRHKSKSSPDKRSHGFYVTFDKDMDGRLTAKDIVLSNALISVGPDGQKNVEGFDAKIDLEGHLLAAVSSAGPYGKVVQSPMNPKSSQTEKLFKIEASIHLEQMDMASLTK